MFSSNLFAHGSELPVAFLLYHASGWKTCVWADGGIASELCWGIVLGLASQGGWLFFVLPMFPDMETKGCTRDAINVFKGRERV